MNYHHLLPHEKDGSTIYFITSLQTNWPILSRFRPKSLVTCLGQRRIREYNCHCIDATTSPMKGRRGKSGSEDWDKVSKGKRDSFIYRFEYFMSKSDLGQKTSFGSVNGRDYRRRWLRVVLLRIFGILRPLPTDQQITESLAVEDSQELQFWFSLRREDRRSHGSCQSICNLFTYN